MVYNKIRNTTWAVLQLSVLAVQFDSKHINSETDQLRSVFQVMCLFNPIGWPVASSPILALDTSPSTFFYLSYLKWKRIEMK